MIYYIFFYLLIFANTYFDFRFAGTQKHSIKNYLNYENKIN